MNEVLKKKFVALANELEPENLSCDGLLSPAKLKAKFRSIKKKWSVLEVEAGRKVSKEDAWMFDPVYAKFMAGNK